MKKKAKRHSKGQEAFTLIELLVVVAIIGLLSAVVMFSVTNAREKAYDTKRVEDLRQLQIAGELRLLENVQIPTAATNLDPSQYASNQTGEENSSTLDSIVRYITMTPNEAEADAAQYSGSVAYYDALFTNGFFRPGSTKPQDPQCVPSQPHTCYRAYYNASDKVLVIASTLRTKKHSSGYNVQYGIAIGGGVNNETLVRTCQAIGFPVFDSGQSATNFAAACNPLEQISSIVQGITNGRNINGSSGTGSI